jgi:hypothetical protein
LPGAPHVQLLFPSVWDTSNDATHLEMAVGFQGRVWNWHGGRLMEPGPFGAFDGGCIFWHPNLIELAGGDWALPYTGYAFPHKYPRGAWSYRPGYAIWPKGRLVAVEAAETGEFSTAGREVANQRAGAAGRQRIGGDHPARRHTPARPRV